MRRKERVILAMGTEGPVSGNSALVDELAGLAQSAGGEVVGHVLQKRPRRSGRQVIGKGKLAELAAMCDQLKGDLVVVGQDLTPIQLRQLEDALPCRVLDRTTLILDIFAQRARSREGQLQVELAQHLYRLPRLLGRGKEMSRTAGGVRGGMGTRGPGEQALEYDRRRIRNRMALLRREIDKLRRRRAQQRERRKENAFPAIVLVGYTNAGKSTLFNALSKSRALVHEKMFATLDPQVRLLRMPDGGRALLSDTVGFIHELPADLRVAFRATLEEVAMADMLVHVVDASHPQADRHIETVLEELRKMGVPEIPLLTVMNKTDRLGTARILVEPLAAQLAPAVFVSARDGEGLGGLLGAMEGLLRERFWTRLSWENPSPQIRSRLMSMGVSVRERVRDNGKGQADVVIEAWMAPAHAAQLSKLDAGTRA